MAEKIAEELYVTLKAQPITEYKDGKFVVTGQNPPLGFAHPHMPGTKADEKKKETQLNWAYDQSCIEQLEPVTSAAPDERVYRHRRLTGRYFDSEGLLHLTGVDEENIYNTTHPFAVGKTVKHPNFDILVPQNLQPRIVKNEPVYGFQIQRSVSRYSTSNKLWRVLDPRGFELEITTGNFEDIVMDGIIHEGTIEGKCQWHGKKLVMVSV